MRPKISLLHATYRRESSPLEVKRCWLERSEYPDLVEHIFAMDGDDELSLEYTEGSSRVVGPPGEGWVTSVRNWNAAAAESSGDVLFVIADDLFPPMGWDTKLVEVIGNLDPRKTPFAVKVADDPREDDVLLRHPVVSRAFYERLGLFSEKLHGVYCDDDITLRSYWGAAIIDGRSLVLEHRHPTLAATPVSESQRRVNDPREYQHGSAVYSGSWSKLKRSARVVLVSPAGDLNDGKMRILGWRNRMRTRVKFFLCRGIRLVWLILRPHKLGSLLRVKRGGHRSLVDAP